MDKLRIVIAEKDVKSKKQLKDILTIAGHEVVGEAEDGLAAMRMIRSKQPDVVLASSDLRGSSGIELAKMIEESRIAAAILLADYSDRDIIFRGRERWAFPIIMRPVDEFNLLSVIDYAYSNFNKVVELEREVTKLKSDLETRKTVEKAKGILMKSHGLTEEEAFKRIQQQSMKKRTTMKNIAEAIILSYEISK